VKIPATRYAMSPDGAHLAYQAFGTGDVDLLWISPWFSHLELLWEYPTVMRFHREMASFARVIMFDQRGIGLSDRTKGIPDLETRVDDLRAVLDAAGSERSVLWGAGPDGGALCAMLAATQPDRVLALAFWNAWARTAWAPDYPWGTPIDELEATDARWEEIWGLEEHAAELMREAGAPSIADDPVAVRWSAKVCRHMAAPGDLREFNRMWNEIDFRSILPSIHTPTLCVFTTGADDGPNRALADGIPGARIAELPNFGDMPPWPRNSTAAVDVLRSFVDGVRDQERELDRVLATILFTDIVDSTATAAVMGDAKWRGVLAEHDRIAKGLIARYRGEYRKSTGDGLMATFDGPARAIRCARAFSEAVTPLGIEIRAGAHTGEVTFGHDDLAGIGVHVAARVAAMAGTSEVWASSTVKDLTAGSGLTFEDAGEHELKGVPDRWRLYRVIA
jgi:class 3 adenylate cyclase